jgi:hypothetical protein
MLYAAGLSVAAIAYLLYEGPRQPSWLERWLQVGTVATAAVVALALIVVDLCRNPTSGASSKSAIAAMLAGTGALVYALAVAMLHQVQSWGTALLVLAATTVVAAALWYIQRDASWRLRLIRMSLICVTIASAYACVNVGTAGAGGGYVRGAGPATVPNTLCPAY